MTVLFNIVQLEMAEPGFELMSSNPSEIPTTLSFPIASGLHKSSTFKLNVVL